METNRIAMDTDALLAAAEKVDGSVNEIRESIRKFQSIIEGLNSSWSSEVKDKFFAGYERDMRALSEMTAQYSEVAAGLRQISEYHAKSEEDIKNQIERARKAHG